MPTRARRRKPNTAGAKSKSEKQAVPAPAPHRPRNAAFVSALFSRYRTLQSEGWTPNLVSGLILLTMVRVLGAVFGVMSDCDEAYNYWEPLHYMMYGRGLQTWEYSPKYALRSYAYLLPYAFTARGTAKLASFSASVSSTGGWDKVREFYSIRVAQALISAISELALYDSAVWRFGPRRGRVFLALLATSPGIFRAAPELLPSSFAMITLTSAWSYWLVGEFPKAVGFVAFAGLFGWIYAAAAALPMALHVMYRRGVGRFVHYAVGAAVPIAGCMVAIDSYYYGRPVLVPLLHVLYNVFPVAGAGPELFGVEPFMYYVINMVLNVPLAVPMVALLPAQLLLQAVGARIWDDAKSTMNRCIFLSGPLVMGALMAAVPHKEERFLAPLYPMLALLSAVVLIDWLDFISRFLPAPNDVKSNTIKLFTISAVAFTAALGVSRAYMQTHAFGAPLRIYSAFARDQLAKLPDKGPDINLCLGKEWHRFPSHFFIPNQRVKVRFVKHGFNGALPHYYVDTPLASRVHQDGMNMFNEAQPSQWFNVSSDNACHYLVDLDLSHREPETTSSDSEEVESIPQAARHVLYSEPFLDVERSPAGIRAFWIPRHNDRLVYGNYVVVRNKYLSL